MTLRNTYACVIAALGIVGTPTAAAQFDFDNVTLRSWIPLDGFSTNPSTGNDCWGYTSSSGREYALMGIRDALAVVEITDPDNPVIVEEITHSESLWGDIKVYEDHCYVVNENGGGIDVIDLSDVDNGNVTLVQQVNDNGLQTSHNVVIDTASGFLYLVGANIHGGNLVAYDLSNPADPVEVGHVPDFEGTYIHDAQVVTYDSGPYAGKQIAFCANGGVGVHIYDVTDKSNMFRLSETTYPNLSYAHQCWLSDDKQYLYLDDELDGVDETVIFDVSDLSNPVVVNTYSVGTKAIDHNLYVYDGFIYEAQYRSGIHVFCAADPENPVHVGFFDTYPENDGSGFDGAWSVYPFFGDGIVLISDMNRGLFVIDVTDALNVLPECQGGEGIPGDVDGDGTVGILDFLDLLAAWGPCPEPCPPSCSADFDNDCQVGITDLLILLANWS